MVQLYDHFAGCTFFALELYYVILRGVSIIYSTLIDINGLDIILGFQRKTYDSFIAVDSVASNAVQVGSVQERTEAKTRRFLLCHHAGYKMALPEQAEEETECKQSMAAQPSDSQQNQKNSCVSTAV